MKQFRRVIARNRNSPEIEFGLGIVDRQQQRFAVWGPIFDSCIGKRGRQVKLPLILAAKRRTYVQGRQSTTSFEGDPVPVR